ncbi:MAG: hypothetical protein IPL78_11080 [Chloroflexi bacterium]|nr:hypothetical protein [Chloroflexota bacterium]
MPFCCGQLTTSTLVVTGEPTQFVPSSQAVPGVQTIKALPNPNYVLLWNVSDLYLYDLNEHLLYPINNPAGSSLTGVQGVWVRQPTADNNLLYRLGLERYRLLSYQIPVSRRHLHRHLTSEPTSTLSPPARQQKNSESDGWGINQFEELPFLVGQGVDALIWIWTVDSLYYLPTREAVQTEAVSLVAG